MARQVSLRPLLIGVIALLLTCVVGIIAVLTVRSQNSSNTNIQTSFDSATTDLSETLFQRLEAMRTSQASVSEASLDAKALNSARLIAGSVVNALVVSEIEGLDSACALIDQDPEMVVAIVYDAKGSAVSTHWSVKAKEILGTTQTSQSSEQLEALCVKGVLRLARTPITQDGQQLGEVLVIASTSILKKQLELDARTMNETRKAMELEFLSTQKAMISEIGNASTTMRWQIILTGVIGVIAASLIFSSLASWIVSPIRAVVTALRRVAEGDYQVHLVTRGTREVVEMTIALGTTVKTLNTQRSGINTAIQALTSQAAQMTSLAKDISKSVVDTSSQAEGAAIASTTVSVNISAVSAAAEEMAASVKEIANNTTEAARIASEAEVKSEVVRKAMSRLIDASQQIATITTTINTIANQTNLLALNATIEAASAGDAGRGFAVVANEVKELARQSSSATADIAAMIREIQDAVKASSDEIVQVTNIIQRINIIQTAMASAVEEQSATTNEIVRSLGNAANSSQEVARSVKQLSQAASLTKDGATLASASATSLEKLSDDLNSLVGTSR